MKKSIKILIFASCAVCFTIAIASCFRRPLNEPQNVRIEDDVLYWDEVDGAKSYVVKITGQEIEQEIQTTEPQYDLWGLLKVDQSCTVSVHAVGDRLFKLDSKQSEDVEYQLKPTKGLAYKLENNRYTLMVVPEELTKVVVCESIEGIPVTRISGAFTDHINLEYVLLPDTLTGFTAGTFKGCENLKEIFIPKNVTLDSNLGSFTGCKSLQKIEVEEGNVQLGVTDGCLVDQRYQRLLATANTGVIPHGVYEIATKSVNIYNGTDLVIPDTVQEIRDGFLSPACTIRQIVVDEKNPYFKSDGNCLVLNGSKSNGLSGYMETYAFPVLAAGETFTIPSYCEAINSYAFEGKSMTSFTVPSQIKAIGTFAFQNCGELQSLIISQGVEVIYEGAFKGCRSLASVIIPDSVTQIDYYCFDGPTIYCTGSWLDHSIWSHTDLAGALCYSGWACRLYLGGTATWYGYDDGSVVVWDCELKYDDGVPYVYSNTVGDIEYGAIANLYIYSKETSERKIGQTQLGVPTRAGYTFLGWTREEGGTTAEYAVNDIKNLDGNIPSDTVLYAVWQKNA